MRKNNNNIFNKINLLTGISLLFFVSNCAKNKNNTKDDDHSNKPTVCQLDHIDPQSANAIPPGGTQTFSAFSKSGPLVVDWSLDTTKTPQECQDISFDQTHSSVTTVIGQVIGLKSCTAVIQAKESDACPIKTVNLEINGNQAVALCKLDHLDPIAPGALDSQAQQKISAYSKTGEPVNVNWLLRVPAKPYEPSSSDCTNTDIILDNTSGPNLTITNNIVGPQSCVAVIQAKESDDCELKTVNIPANGNKPVNDLCKLHQIVIDQSTKPFNSGDSRVITAKTFDPNPLPLSNVVWSIDTSKTPTQCQDVRFNTDSSGKTQITAYNTSKDPCVAMIVATIGSGTSECVARTNLEIQGVAGSLCPLSNIKLSNPNAKDPINPPNLYDGQGVTLTATPYTADRYPFVQWSVGSGSSPNCDIRQGFFMMPDSILIYAANTTGTQTPCSLIMNAAANIFMPAEKSVTLCTLSTNLTVARGLTGRWKYNDEKGNSEELNIEPRYAIRFSSKSLLYKPQRVVALSQNGSPTPLRMVGDAPFADSIKLDVKQGKVGMKGTLQYIRESKNGKIEDTVEFTSGLIPKTKTYTRVE